MTTSVTDELIAFARGVPAIDALPVAELQKAAACALRRDPGAILSYGGGAGWAPLRSWLADMHGVDIERVVVTTGSLQGFALLAEVLQARARAGGRQLRVAVENPTYDRPLIVLRRLGIEVTQLPTDADGVRVDGLVDVLERDAVDLVYLIPTFQNPSGATLSQSRRTAVLEAVASSSALLLEDDPYGELHFDTPAPPRLIDSDASGRVLFSGSFSKTIAPGLRVGWLVLESELAAEVSQLGNDTFISPSLLGQATVHEFLAAGHLPAMLERTRATLRSRRDALADALERHLPGSLGAPPGGGYFAWITLPDGTDGAALLEASTKRGASFVPGSAFGPGNEQRARLAFSSPAIGLIEEGVRRIAAACRD